MSRSPYISRIRQAIGTDVLLVPTIAAALFDDDGRMLLVHHCDGGRWAPIGGMIEPGERPREAAAREVAEEVGLTAEVGPVIDVFGGPACATTYANGDRILFVATMFACRVVEGVLRLQESEVDEARWCDLPAALSLDLKPWAVGALPEAFAWRSARGA